jgi:hypothetical protein
MYGVILQNLDWLQLKFDFVSGTATHFRQFQMRQPHEVEESTRKIPIIDHLYETCTYELG